MNRRKWSRTPHLPHSEGRSSDDIGLFDCSQFEGRDVVITLKLDGENACAYPDGYTHARSMDSRHHVSRSWLKQYAATFAYDIPSGMRVCGENLYAHHSVFYRNLPTYFMVFGIVDEQERLLSWADTKELCELLGLTTVPVLYEGPWKPDPVEFPIRSEIEAFRRYDDGSMIPCDHEGYVVRLAESFEVEKFGESAAKYVRKNHVDTSDHWMIKPVVPNQLAEPKSG